MLPNGARFYIDHGHREYSTPEAIDPRTVVAADKAGELVLLECCRRARGDSRLGSTTSEILVHKNNVDYQGSSYGCHENYLLDAAVFEALFGKRLHRLLRFFVPFLVTRQLFTGAGKVGAENGTAPVGFQLSQRADYLETLIGLQTTHRRPIINTRDEPHADGARFRRLHVIVGDANMAEYATYLKIGVTQLVLLMIEDECLRADLTLADPIQSVQTVARDLTFQRPLQLESGAQLTALDIQRCYLDAARGFLEERPPDDPLHRVADVWEEVLDRLARDWRLLATRLDWAIKRRMLERYLERSNLTWEIVSRWQPIVEAGLDATRRSGAVRDGLGQDSTVSRYLDENQLDFGDFERQREAYFDLRRFDLEYHSIHRDAEDGAHGIFYRLQRAGGVDRLLDDAEIERFVAHPPETTRAYTRGVCLKKWRARVLGVDWERVTLAPGQPAGRAVTVELPDPCRGGRDEFESFGNDLHGAPAAPDQLVCVIGESEHIQTDKDH